MVFVVVFGLARETFLLPLVIGESLGAKRLGALLGILAFFTTLGFAAGPIIAGRIFDVLGSYTTALILFAAMTLISCARDPRDPSACRGARAPRGRANRRCKGVSDLLG